MNRLPAWIIKEATKKPRIIKIPERPGGGLKRFMDNPVVKYLLSLEKALEHIDGQSRHLAITKNLAAYAVLCGLKHDQVLAVSRDLSTKMQDKGERELYNWFLWFLRREQNEGKTAEYNRVEMIKFLEALKHDTETI